MKDQQKILLFLLICFLFVSFLFNIKEYNLKNENFSITNKIIWMYWETPKEKHKPYFIEQCHRLVREKNPNAQIIILNPSNIKNYISVPKSWYQLQHIAHRADYVRIAILYYYGGIYIDSDMIMLNSLDPIFKLLNNYDFIAYEYQSKLNKSKNNGKKSEIDIGSYYDYLDINRGITPHTYRIPIGFLASKPKTPLFKEWLMHANRVLDQSNKNKGKILWHNMGRKILTPLLEKLVKQGKMRYCGIPAEATVVPIKNKDNYKFFQNLPLSNIIKNKNKNKNKVSNSKNFDINHYQPFIVLFNSFMPKLQSITPSSIQRQRDLINKLFYYALNE